MCTSILLRITICRVQYTQVHASLLACNNARANACPILNHSRGGGTVPAITRTARHVFIWSPEKEGEKSDVGSCLGMSGRHGWV